MWDLKADLSAKATFSIEAGTVSRRDSIMEIQFDKSIDEMYAF